MLKDLIILANRLDEKGLKKEANVLDYIIQKFAQEGVDISPEELGIEEQGDEDIELVNLTPHDITLRLEDGSDFIVPTSGTVARVSSTPGEQGRIKGIPVQVWGKTTFGEIEDLPDPEPGKIFLVSGLVGSRVEGRDDVLVPGTGPRDGAIREDGKIVAITRLNRV